VTPCIEWGGKRDRDGYGRRGARLAHRLTWEEVNGPIPHGLCICHRCDNPPCVNPDHLFLGTHADNRRDSVAKGREWRKVPVSEHARILERLRAGERQGDIAASHGVNRNQIRRITSAYGWEYHGPICPRHDVAKRTTRSGRRYCHVCVTERSRRRRLLERVPA
jgi:hypothetical protein